MSTLVLGKAVVRRLLDMRIVIDVVEEAFRGWVNGEAQMPPKCYLCVDKGDFRAMPAAVSGAVGIKWVNVHPGNVSGGWPSVMGIIVYNDPSTGYPLAVMDATEITAYRTGAAAAIASRYLARKDSHTLGIIGAGRQAYTQLIAHAELFDLREIKVFDIRDDAVRKMVRHFSGYPIRRADIKEAADADIVCTVTPATSPVLRKEWIKPGTHINAVGADAAGKQELDPSILRSAVVVVDDARQASSGGEINIPLKTGLFKMEDIYATLGEVVTGGKVGRLSDWEITIFDSTGVAIEDIAVARVIYDKASALGRGRRVRFIED